MNNQTKHSEEVSLDSLGGGAAVERFQLALQDVLNNIIDPNTEAMKARSIILKITIKPDKSREFGAAMIAVEKKLAPIVPAETKIFMGRDKKGNGVACEYDPGQMNVFAPAEMPANVTQMKKEVAAP